MHVTIVGAGFVGLPTGVALALHGHSVIVIDNDERRVDLINQGVSPHFEQDLGLHLSAVVADQRLLATAEEEPSLSGTDVVMICVPTPSTVDGPDLSILLGVVTSLAPRLPHHVTLIVKSTVAVGTIRSLVAPLLRDDIELIYAPEFLRTGSAVADSLKPERVVFGTRTGEGAEVARELFSFTGAPAIVTNFESAELIKYAANLFLAMKVSFINEVARLADHVGADVSVLRDALGRDSRIGASHLAPGPGWGGSCFPKDIAALEHLRTALGITSPLLTATHESNDDHVSYVVAKIRESVHRSGGSTVAIMGLAFKAGTNDLRDSPALRIARALRDAGLEVRAYDPVISAGTQHLDGIEVCSDAISATTGASLVVILTEWPDFLQLPWADIAHAMATPVVFDTRYFVPEEQFRDAGLQQIGIGLPAPAVKVTQ